MTILYFQFPIKLEDIYVLKKKEAKLVYSNRQRRESNQKS